MNIRYTHFLKAELVIGVIAIALNLVGYFYTQYSLSPQEKKHQELVKDLDRIEIYLLNFKKLCDRYPKSLAAIDFNKSPIKQSCTQNSQVSKLLLDVFNNPYVYALDGSQYYLKSKGINSQDSSDDIYAEASTRKK